MPSTDDIDLFILGVTIAIPVMGALIAFDIWHSRKRK